jgi:hypothetical protein
MIVTSVVGGPTSGYSFPRDADEVKANARLIAAAPELLEALMRLDAYHSLMVSSVDRQAIRDAIAKATQP